MKSFSLLKTNVALSGNVKLVCQSDSSIYLDSINSEPILSNSKYKKIPVLSGEYWNEALGKFFKNYPKELIFKVSYSSDNSVMYSDFENQVDPLYLSGCDNISQNKEYTEEYEAFAPLWIEKDSIPRGFVIFRVDGPGFQDITRENFRSLILEKMKFVKLWDFSLSSGIGNFLKLNFEDNPNFPISSLRIDFRENEFSYWSGIDTNSGLWEKRGVILNSTLSEESSFFDLQKNILDYYKEFNLIHPNVLNISFLFDDTPSDKNNLRKWSINRYYGFYLEDLILEKRVSFFEPLVMQVTCVITTGNLLTTTDGSEPFVEQWRILDFTWIQIRGVFYKTIPTQDPKIWQVISQDDLSGLDSSSINSDIWTITQDNALKIKDFRNPCDIVTTPTDVLIENFESKDIWAIKMGDFLFRILKNNETGEFSILCDGGFRIYPQRVEYFYNFPQPESIFRIPTVSSDLRPIEYEIYSIKFLDIKDFDNDIIDTKLSRYQYEFDDKLNRTSDEKKFFFTDYTDRNHPKDFEKFDLNGEVTYIPCSSEYTSSWETFRLDGRELSQIWRKNPVFVKWGFKNSMSKNEYPYLLNNSFLMSKSNDTSNTFELSPSKDSNNLDWFYSINRESNNFSFQSLHTSTRKYTLFNLGDYLTTSTDYFTEYFGQDVEYNGGKELKNIQKWSKFNSGDSVTPNITLFGGIKFGMFNIESIDVGLRDINSVNFSTSNDFDDWKFSVLLDRPEFSYFRVEKCNTDCLGPEENKIIKLSSLDIPTDIITGTYGFVKDLFGCWRITEQVSDTRENFTFSGSLISDICNYCKPDVWILDPCQNCGEITEPQRKYLIPSYIQVEDMSGIVIDDLCFQFTSSNTQDCSGATLITTQELDGRINDICNYCGDNYIAQCSTTTTTTSTTTILVTTTSTTTEEQITTSTTTEEQITTSTTTEEQITTSTTTSFVSPGFTSSFVLSTSPRYIPLQSNIGNWDVFSDFSSGVTRNSNNNPLSQPLFTTPLFSFNDPQSSLNISVLDSSGNFYSGLTSSLDSDGTESGSGFTITKIGRVQQGTLWEIQASGNITLPEALPIGGGRFKVRLTLTDGSYIETHTSEDYFWDNDGTQSSINTSQLPELSSLNNQVVVYSGISYFTTGNIFRMSLGDINLLNDQTIPTTRQISMESVLLPSTPVVIDGFGDGTKPSIGIAIQGWTLSSSSSGLTFSATSSMTQISGNYHPGFVNTTSNSLSAYNNVHLVSKLFDWGESLSLQSSNYNLLIDTYTSSVPSDTLINPVDGEYNRFSFASRTTSGYTPFTSSIPLSTNLSELQYIFGRIIYPQHNFTGILPLSYDYTSLPGISSTFSVFTELITETKIQVTLSDYKWYVTRYQRPDTNTFTNGRFIFDSNWNEQDLTNEDLAILVRINNDGFLLLSGDIGSYDGRTLLDVNNLDNPEKSISFSTGANITPSRVWLLVGYRNTPRGKNLWVSNISLTTGSS